MKKVLILILLGLFTSPLSIFAQDISAHASRHSCGTSMDAQQIGFRDMVELRNRYPHSVTPRAIAYIPVWFHMVAASNGVGRTTEANVADMLCEWNRLFSSNGLELRFYIKGFSKIDLDALYNGPQSFAGTNRMITTKKTDAMNVYLVNNCGNGTEPPGTVILAYYSNRSTNLDAEYSNDWIVCANSQVSKAGASTIAHEAGHMFSLPHTFYGWEEAGPFEGTSTAPCAPLSLNYNGRVVTVEKVARSGTSKNCDFAGDGFCDTPEDYNFGFSQSTRGCTWAGIAKDPDCVAVNPDETNLMSYFGASCTVKFSAEQKAAINNNYLNHAKRAYLRAGNITPPLTAALPTLITPAANATTAFSNNVPLDWSDVPGALGYNVEVSRFTSFAQTKAFYTTTSNLNVNTLNTGGYMIAGTKYYWRVRAVVPFNNCANTASGSFTTGTLNAVQTIEGVTQFTASPNPLSKTQDLVLQMNSETAFDATVKLVNMTGQVIKSEKRRFTVGYSTQNLVVSDLTNGTYILAIKSEKGVLNKRIVVQ
ncbi:MAG: zinc-dependent metalloprotease [Saprospiraceae bacterium]|nr:zinc-dependent metalloprotease [Saprospiraceae bacterium]